MAPTTSDLVGLYAHNYFRRVDAEPSAATRATMEIAASIAANPTGGVGIHELLDRFQDISGPSATGAVTVGFYLGAGQTLYGAYVQLDAADKEQVDDYRETLGLDEPAGNDLDTLIDLLASYVRVDEGA